MPVTIGRSGLILLVTGSPGTASIIAQAIDESSLTEQEGRSRATIRSSSCSPTSPPRGLARALRPDPIGRRRARRSRRLPLTTRRPSSHEEGRPRLFRRARHVRRRRVAAREVRLRGRLPDGRRRRRLAPRGRRAAGDQRRRVARLRRRCPRAVRPRLRLAAPPGERAVPGRVSAGHRAGPAADRPAPGRGRAARGRRRGRPRLHRQGQRPGPVRRRGPRPRPGARGRRPDAGRDGPDPRPGDRLRRRARDRDPDHEGVAVLDRREPVGPLVRDGRARGPVGHAAAGRVRVDGRPVRRRPSPVELVDRVRGRDPGRDRRRAARRRSSSSTGSTRWAARTASAGSTTSRTASSGSRAARSTRRRPRRSCTRRTARSRA